MMMKALACALLVCCVNFATAQDYVLRIDGSTQELDLEKEVQFRLQDGRSLRVLLKQKEFLSYDGDAFRFEHHRDFKPSRTDLGDGVRQTMMMTPLGTGIMVQEHGTTNPELYVDVILRELVKEEIDYGYKYKEVPVERRVGNITFRGRTGTTTLKGEEWTRSVLAMGGKDEGLIVVTFIERDNVARESKLIERFWKTFRVVDE